MDKPLLTGEHENPYYASVSAKLRRARYMCAFLAVVTALLLLFAYRNNITYDNLRYLLRDVDEAASAWTADNDSAETGIFIYDADDSNFYAAFRGDLAVCGKGSVEIKRMSGSSYQDKTNLNSPIAVASHKYMAVCDIGGKELYIYNSIGRVYYEETEGAIYGCAVSDNGCFAVLTRNRVGGFNIKIYNKNFKPVSELSRKGYVSSIYFLSDGRLAICECSAESISIVTALSVYTLGKNEIDFSVSSDGFALKCGNIGDKIYLLTDNTLNFFDKSGEKTFSTSFGTSDILYASADSNAICLLTDENISGSDCGVYIYFADGTSTSCEVERGARDVALYEKKAYVLYDNMIVTAGNAENNEKNVKKIPEGAKKIFLFDKDSAIICYGDKANKIKNSG